VRYTNGNIYRDTSGNAYYDFDPGQGVDYLQRISIPQNYTIKIMLQWDDVNGGPKSQRLAEVCVGL